MPTLKAIVSGGRAIIEDDEMSEESRTKLHAAIRESLTEPTSERVSADVLLDDMRAQLG